MIDEDFDFGRPKFIHTQWGLLVLLLALIVTGIFWWNDSIEKERRIAELVKDNQRLADRLEDAEVNPNTSTNPNDSMFQPATFQREPVNELTPKDSDAARDEVESLSPAEYQFDVASFIAKIRNAGSPEMLDSIDHKEVGISAAIPELLALTEEKRHCLNALVSLQMMTIPPRYRRRVADTLVSVIDQYRFGDVEDCELINHNAYAFLVILGDASPSVLDRLSKIMYSDHSPWAGYACVSMKMLDPKADVQKRLLELLESPFETNRLVVVKTLVKLIEPELAKKTLEAMYDDEPSELVKKSIVNAMNFLTN